MNTSFAALHAKEFKDDECEPKVHEVTLDTSAGETTALPPITADADPANFAFSASDATGEALPTG